MKLEKYTDQLHRLPPEGRHIIGQLSDDSIIVYQAYKPSIARAAEKDQRLQGGGFKYERMSWIKPGFLWMMYRAGWATKENQEHILAIEIGKNEFKEVLEKAVHSSYKAHIYGTEHNWKAAMAASDVRLQWDPDHDPHGNKLERRAIQLGMQGETLKNFAKHWIRSIRDITPFVEEQRLKRESGRLDELIVPYEEVLEIGEQELKKKLELGKA